MPEYTDKQYEEIVRNLNTPGTAEEFYNNRCMDPMYVDGFE